MPFDLDNFMANPFTQMGFATLANPQNPGAGMAQGMQNAQKLQKEQKAKEGLAEFFKGVRAKKGDVGKEDIFNATAALADSGYDPETIQTAMKFGLSFAKDEGTEFSKLLKERNSLPAGSPDQQAYDGYIRNKGIDPFTRMTFANSLKPNEAIIDYSSGATSPSRPAMPGMGAAATSYAPPASDAAMNKEMESAVPPPMQPGQTPVDTFQFSKAGNVPSPVGALSEMASQPAPQMSPSPAQPAPEAPSDDIQASIERARFNKRRAEAVGDAKNAKYWGDDLDSLLRVDERNRSVQTRQEEMKAKQEAAAAAIAVPGYDVSPGYKPSQDDAKTLKSAEQAKGIILGELDKLEALTKQYGAEVIPLGEVNNQMAQHRKNILLNAKELENLGVLNGPDVAVLEKQLADPTSLKAALLGSDAMQTNYGNYRSYVNQRAKETAKARGYAPKEQQQSANTKTIGGKTYTNVNGKWFEQ